MVSENKNTEFKVLLQPETDSIKSVSGLFSLNHPSIQENNTRATKRINLKTDK